MTFVTTHSDQYFYQVCWIFKPLALIKVHTVTPPPPPFIFLIERLGLETYATIDVARLLCEPKWSECWNYYYCSIGRNLELYS